MRNQRTRAVQGNGGQNHALLRFPLDGVLPSSQILVISPTMRTVTLLSQQNGGEASIVAQRQFSPNGIRVLIALLQAYPHYCPHEELLACLYPLSPETCSRRLQANWDMEIRPVRRAVGSLITGLHACGLSVCSLRGTGYIIERLRPSTGQRGHVEEGDKRL